MKLQRSSPAARPREQGFFLVIVMLILAAIMLLYSAANGRRLANLREEIRLVERQQQQRLNHSPNVATNPPAAPLIAPASVP